MAQPRDPRRITSETGDGWRRLGFYHEPDHEQRLWRFVGSRMGLGQLADELRRCAETETGSEHGIRLGPYEDLVLYRWDRPGSDDHGIYGPPVALTSLADMVEENLGAPGSSADPWAPTTCAGWLWPAPSSILALTPTMKTWV